MSWTTSTISGGTAIVGSVSGSDYEAVLKEAMKWLGEKDFLVVAATGNNALDAPVGARPPARKPAGFDTTDGIVNLLSVAATDITCTAPANYTNQLSNTGVATLGGDADLVQVVNPPPNPPNDPWTEIEVENVATGDLDAVKGIFWPQSLVIDNAKQSTNGWVCWVGTSFAAPIMSAIAALYWADHLNLTASQVIGQIQGTFTGPAVGDLAGPTIYARQEIV
jgi:subtilisin family serine protease